MQIMCKPLAIDAVYPCLLLRYLNIPWKLILMIEILSPSNSFQSPRIHQINSTNISIHLRHRHLWKPVLSLCFFSLLLDLSSIRLFISSEVSFSGNLSLRNCNTTQRLVLYSFCFSSPYLKKTKTKNQTKQKPQLTLKQTNKPQQKQPFLLKLIIRLWRLDCNTGSLCYCRIICKNCPTGQKLHRIPKRSFHWSRSKISSRRQILRKC